MLERVCLCWSEPKVLNRFVGHRAGILFESWHFSNLADDHR